MTRLDLFLKYAGLIKQRSAAKRACEAGQVRVDGQPAKASRLVRVGETVRIETPGLLLEVQVIDIPLRQPAKAERDRFFNIQRRERLDVRDDTVVDGDFSF